MMKKNRGQALVEFLLIIPILVLLILSIIDVGNIVINKYKLEDDMSTVLEYYENNRSTDIEHFCTLNNLNISYNDENNYITIKISKNLSIMTPGLNNIIGKNFKIETKRVVYHE